MKTAMVAAIVTCMWFSIPGRAATYTVCPDGSGDYPTVQSAIDASTNGDVIELADGTFTGDGNRDINYGGRQITVCSRSGAPTDCVMDCQGSEVEPHRGFLFDSHEGHLSVLRGITIEDGYQDAGGGVMVWFSDPLIRDCVFLNNRAEQGAGGWWYGCPDAVLIDCQFRHNTAALVGGGIYGWETPFRLNGCTFDANAAESWGGGVCALYGEPTVTNCTFHHNSALEGGAIGAFDQLTLANCILTSTLEGTVVECEGGIIVTCCDVFGNEAGDYNGCLAGQNGQNGNFSLDPLFCDPVLGDFRLEAGSPCAPEHNPQCGLVGAWPVGCTAASVEERPGSAAGFYSLPPMPNPSRGQTEIRYVTPPSAVVGPDVIDIYDLAGRLVRRLTGSPVSEALHEVVWDGRDDVGNALPSGVYLARIETAAGLVTGKITLAK